MPLLLFFPLSSLSLPLSSSTHFLLPQPSPSTLVCEASVLVGALANPYHAPVIPRVRNMSNNNFQPAYYPHHNFPYGAVAQPAAGEFNTGANQATSPQFFIMRAPAGGNSTMAVGEPKNKGAAKDYSWLFGQDSPYYVAQKSTNSVPAPVPAPAQTGQSAATKGQRWSAVVQVSAKPAVKKPGKLNIAGFCVCCFHSLLPSGRLVADENDSCRILALEGGCIGAFVWGLFGLFCSGL
ncbi:hypothetical protein HOY82DRAFT_543820 [Tuber indicum]|nr:hypothetical protein HOY82DRAFT_543820 [Tuber indicum]